MRYALVGAGSVGNSFIARLPHLSRDLGHVAAASFRLASRIANTLGAGSPVRNMDALDSSRTILICAPGGCIKDIAGELSRANINWNKKTLLLCDSNAYSDTLLDFHARGASTGSINLLGGMANRFIVEGDHAASRGAKYLVQELKGAMIELGRDKLLSYDAAVTLASSLFTPLIESCVQCLQAAGATGVEPARIAEALFQQSLRAYMRAGKKSWSGALASGDARAIERQLEALARSKPLVACYYRNSAIFALEFLERHPELRHRLAAAAGSPRT